MTFFSLTPGSQISTVVCLVLSCLFLVFFAFCSITHLLSSAHVFLCPTLGSAVYCAFLKRFATRPKPIPLWHLLFETPGLCSFVILFLPAGGTYLFVFLIVLQPFVLCFYFLSTHEGRSSNFWVYTHPHTSCASPGMARGQR